MTSLRRFFARGSRAVAALAVVATLAAATGPSAVAQSSKELPTLRIGAAMDDQSTPLLYAEQAGLFRKAGLNVVVNRMNSGAAIASAVAGGSLEIGKASMVNLITAHARSMPFTLIAPAGIYRSNVPDGGLIVGAKSTIRSAKDLSGKTIAVSSLNDLNSIATQDWIDQNGGDSRAVHFIELPPIAVPDALQQGRIDGATLWNPVMTEAVSAGKARIAAHVFDAIAGRYQVAAWFASDDWVAKHRDVVEKFAAAMHEANLYVASHEDETVPLIAKFLGVDVADLSHMARSMPASYLDPTEIQPVITAATKYKVISKDFAAQDFISPYALRLKKT
jgi:NitT/TauT family transport system substrate-binding protein